MTTGRAIVQTVFPGSNPAESMSLVRKEKPRPSPHNVVVRMIASAVNPVDLIYIRNSFLGRFENKGAVHGSEGVGVVDEIGEGVTSCRVGERVIPLVFWKYYCGRGEGAWQDYVEVAEEDVVPVPDTMSDAVAAQFVINPWTLYGMLHDLQIPKGKYLLQTAAGSVLGRQCIQLAKHWDIKTINIVRRDELKDELTAIGADEVINSEKEDIITRVKEITNGEGAYAGIDAVGGMLFKGQHIILFLWVWKPGSNTPPTASGETLICANKSLPKGPIFGGFVGCTIKSEPGSGLFKPTNTISNKGCSWKCER